MNNAFSDGKTFPSQPSFPECSELFREHHLCKLVLSHSPCTCCEPGVPRVHVICHLILAAAGAARIGAQLASAHIPASFTRLPLAEAGSNGVSTREALPRPRSDGQAAPSEAGLAGPAGPVFVTLPLPLSDTSVSAETSIFKTSTDTHAQQSETLYLKLILLPLNGQREGFLLNPTQGHLFPETGDAGAFYRTLSTGHLFTETGEHWCFLPNPVHRVLLPSNRGMRVLFTKPRPRGASSLKQGDTGTFHRTPSTGAGASPRPVLTVVGLNAFHTMVSQMFVAMNREIPEPRPYPFCRSSSRSRTIRPATKSCQH